MYPDEKSDRFVRRRHGRGADGKDLFARLDIGDGAQLGGGDGRVPARPDAQVSPHDGDPVRGVGPDQVAVHLFPEVRHHLDRVLDVAPENRELSVRT